MKNQLFKNIFFLRQGLDGYNGETFYEILGIMYKNREYCDNQKTLE